MENVEKKGITFRELVSSAPMRTSQTYRYSNTRLTDRESLSDHIVDVQMMGYAILKSLNKYYGENLDSGIFLEKCLLHDVDEVLTGDIPRTTKYYNPTILKEAQAVAKHAATQLFTDFFRDESLVEFWEDCKHGKEGILLKLVDMMCVSVKASREVDLLGNGYFLKIVGEVVNYMGDLNTYLDNSSPYNKEATEYLKSVLNDSVTELNRMLEEHKGEVERYDLVANRLQ